MKTALELCKEASAAGDDELAVLLAEEHLKTNPGCAEAKLLLANNLLFRGRWNYAEQILTGLCGSKECSPDSLSLLADLYHMAEKPGQAAATLQTLVDRYELSAARLKEVTGMIERNLRLASLKAMRAAERVETK